MSGDRIDNGFGLVLAVLLTLVWLRMRALQRRGGRS